MEEKFHVRDKSGDGKVNGNSIFITYYYYNDETLLMTVVGDDYDKSSFDNNRTATSSLRNLLMGALKYQVKANGGSEGYLYLDISATKTTNYILSNFKHEWYQVN